MKKDRVESIRLKTNEFEHLNELAESAGLTLGEYIRIKLFESLKSKNATTISEHKRDMTAFTTYGFFLLKRIAEKQLSEAELAEAKEKMMNALEDYKMQERK